MDIGAELYDGGFYAILRRADYKETPLADADQLLLGADADLSALAETVVKPPDVDYNAMPRFEARRKMLELQGILAGQSELVLHHAFVIAVLRRRDPPAQAAALFLRMWREVGQILIAQLDTRWQISAATTFADHGETTDQRLGGLGLSMLYDLIKLHDSERRVSLQPNDMAFPMTSKAHRALPLAFDMQGYSLKGGDLDRNMLARLWRYAEADRVFRPLGTTMLHRVIRDPHSIFGRIQHYKG